MPLVFLIGCTALQTQQNASSELVLLPEEAAILTDVPTAAVTPDGSTPAGVVDDVFSVEEEPVIELDRGINVVASRSFAGPGQFPPRQFAAYGILAFPTDPRFSQATRDRFMRFCEAYSTNIYPASTFEQRGVPSGQQMVTVLPLNSDSAASEASQLPYGEACALAQRRYGLIQAQEAIEEANMAAERTDGISKLSGRGPFLIAWSPAEDKGKTDTVVLVADLTNSVSQEQIAADMRLWVETIQLKPNLWRRGWNLEALRLTGQRWIDRRATGILEVLGEVL
ncbi:MAG: hypothetical protein AB3N15_12035 [Paracoccaceae bacterium]